MRWEGGGRRLPQRSWKQKTILLKLIPPSLKIYSNILNSSLLFMPLFCSSRLTSFDTVRQQWDGSSSQPLQKCEGRIHKTLGGTSLLTVLVRSECRHQTRLRLMCRDCLPCKAVKDYKRRRLTARRAHG